MLPGVILELRQPPHGRLSDISFCLLSSQAFDVAVLRTGLAERDGIASALDGILYEGAAGIAADFADCVCLWIGPAVGIGGIGIDGGDIFLVRIEEAE